MSVDIEVTRCAMCDRPKPYEGSNAPWVCWECAEDGARICDGCHETVVQVPATICTDCVNDSIGA